MSTTTKADPAGIPTLYKGVNFRSRLEARYAVLFDQLGWLWEYEPIDLDGWIPDFVIKGRRPILVEVKPIFDVAAARTGKIMDAAGRWYASESEYKYESEYELLICGASLFKNQFGGLTFCWLLSREWVPLPWDWEWVPTQVFKLPARYGKGHGLCSHTLSYRGQTDLISGRHGSDGFPDLEAMWVNAGNVVQWRGVTPSGR
jgi:hypothetical protein